jgi:hypothetical protein
LTATRISALPDVLRSRLATLAVTREEVIEVPAEVLTKDEHRAVQTPPPTAAPTKKDGLRASARRFPTDRTLRRWISGQGHDL